MKRIATTAQAVLIALLAACGGQEPLGAQGHALYAAWDYTLRVPVCAGFEGCDTDDLLNSAGYSEPNSPNTLHDSCADGTSSTDYVDEIIVAPVSGVWLTAKKTARVTVFVRSSVTVSNKIDLYYTADVVTPVWHYLTTFSTTAAYQSFDYTYTLPTGLVQAIRANLRWAGYGSAYDPCTTGTSDDHDDLAFGVDPGDTTGPTVSLTSPSNGTAANGDIQLWANASDLSGVAKVEFYAGTALIGIVTSGTSFGSVWNSRPFAPGPYVLTARAYDTAGNFTISAPVTITIVPDTTPPEVSLYVPGAGAPLSSAVELSASAWDSFGMARVEFYAGDQLLFTDDSGPYWNFWWDTAAVANGSYAITARAYDVNGNVATSDPVQVTVANPAGTAFYDPSWKAPRCGGIASQCDSGTLLTGNGLSAELHQPNTIGASCADRLSNSTDPEAIDRITVHTLDGSPLSAGAVVQVDAVVVARIANASDHYEIYAASNPASPSWRLIGAGQPSVSGSSVVSVQFALAAGPLQAVRVRFGYVAGGVACGTDSIVDNDDLIFDVAAGTGDVTPPLVSITGPADGATVAGTFQVTATASDDGVVSRVELYLDGVLRSTRWTAPYATSLDTGLFPTGSHTLVARAIDGAGNWTDSTPVTIHVSWVDTTPPMVSITSPAAGSTVSGWITITVNATDDDQVTGVVFYVDGTMVGSSGTSPFSSSWNAGNWSPGNHTLTAKAYDAANNSSSSAPVTIVIPGASGLAYDPALGAPRCSSLVARCDSLDLLTGRGTVGPEPHQPNAIHSSCQDGTAGTYHSDESVEGIAVSSTDGGELRAFGPARIEVRVWAYAGYSSDKLDLYYASDANSPSWVYIATLTPSGAGAQTLSTTYTLPDGSTQAVRAHFRYGGNAAPCGAGSYDDHDDLAFAVRPAPADLTPPTTSVTTPVAGAVLSNTVSVTASANDDRGVVRVELYANSTKLGTATAPPYQVSWNTASVANGSYVLTSQAYDTAGNVGTGSGITVTVSNTQGTALTAAYDSTLRTAACSALGTSCTSGTLLTGRGARGPETNAPNTIYSSCADGTSGTFHSDESLDGLTVATTDGSNFATGKAVRITAQVWAYSGYSSDKLDLYYAPSASSPSWTFITTLTPSGSGLQTLSATYILPSGSLQAIRGRFRYSGSAAPCGTGSYDDHDDLVFAVGP